MLRCDSRKVKEGDTFLAIKGATYDVKEQTKDYDKIITMHNKYLKQIMKDERLSLDERKKVRIRSLKEE